MTSLMPRTGGLSLGLPESRTSSAPPAPGSMAQAAWWCLALALLVAASPLMLILAALVRLASPGPALYRQARRGKSGRVFEIVKFRTMTHRCEAGTGPCWSPPDDPRVTRLGRFLRDSHLDELPQLWNVVRGDMTLIGPRPERPELTPRLEREIPGYLGREVVRPGITGLAQVSQAADLTLDDVRRKLEFDLHYIRHRSLWLDLTILARTALKVADALPGRAPRSLARRGPAKAQGPARVPA